MDRSVRTLSDPNAGPPHPDRRRSIRHKLHTPVYASFNGPQTGTVVDLSELLDLHEEGFAVQTGQRLEVNRPVTVCLDMPETRSFIHGSGRVVWSADDGRGGISFSGLPEKSRQILKQWLFANLMIGCSHQAARTEQLARHGTQNLPDRPESASQPVTPSKHATGATDIASNVLPTTAPNIVPISEGTASLSAVEAVRLVIRDIGSNFDAILQLITERALSFTGAHGAALALLTDMNAEMICRARSGESAPPLGAPVNSKHGLSGECIRSELLVSCVDTESDPRVDPEVCRALGIRSLMAAPIVSDLRVIGLLEVFSPYPQAFTKIHERVLNRLVELIPNADRYEHNLFPTDGLARDPISTRAPSPNPSDAGGKREINRAAAAHPIEREIFSEKNSGLREQPGQPVGGKNTFHDGSEFVPESEPLAPARLLYRALIGLAVVAAFLVIGYLIGPIIDKRYAISSEAAQRAPTSSDATAADSKQNAKNHTLQADMAALQQLASQGDAEASWLLGARYHNGEGVPQDDAQAMKWFQLAAERGHVTAQATLGAYYWAGRGVPQDLSKAYFWSAVAVAQGDENSKARLEGLAAQMTQEQIDDAREQAQAWIRNHSGRAQSESN